MSYLLYRKIYLKIKEIYQAVIDFNPNTSHFATLVAGIDPDSIRLNSRFVVMAGPE